VNFRSSGASSVMACGAACSLVPLAAALQSNPSGNALLARDLAGPAWHQTRRVRFEREHWWPVPLRRGAVSWGCFQRGKSFCRVFLHAKRQRDVEESDLNELWGLFGLSPTADRAEVRKRYREIVATKHPDKRPDDPQAPQKFQRITLAYERLVRAVEKGERPMRTSATGRSTTTVDDYFQDWELELFRVARESDFEVVTPMSDAEVWQATATGQESDGFEGSSEKERIWRPTDARDKKANRTASRSFRSSVNTRSWSEQEANFRAEKQASFTRNISILVFSAVGASSIPLFLSMLKQSMLQQ